MSWLSDEDCRSGSNVVSWCVCVCVPAESVVVCGGGVLRDFSEFQHLLPMYYSGSIYFLLFSMYTRQSYIYFRCRELSADTYRTLQKPMQ